MSSRTGTRLTIRPGRLHGGAWRLFADHRMATAGAIVGLRVPGVAGRRHRHHGQDPARVRPTVERHARRPRASGGGPLSRLAESWDNDDVRVRPARSSRPRTKTRPAHEDAVEGFVTAIDRGRYACLVEPGHAGSAAHRSRPCGPASSAAARSRSATGSTWSATPTARRTRLARIVRIAERRTVLRRSADDTDPPARRRVLVANADQLVIVTRAGRPGAPHRVHRPLPGRGVHRRPRSAAGAHQGRPGRPGRAPRGLRRPRPAACWSPAAASADARALRPSGPRRGPRRAARPVSVMIGHSGVGKSTLVNALVPGPPTGPSAASPASARAGTRRRRRSRCRCAGGGWIIDTPGVRSFGLAHVTPDDLLETFDDLLPGDRRLPAGVRPLRPGRRRTRPAPAARSTRSSPPAARAPRGWHPSGDCSPRVRRATDRCTACD